MRQEILLGTNTAAAWGAGSLADWIEPTLSVKANTSGYIRGACRRTSATDAFWSMDLFLSGGGTPSSGQFTLYDRGASTDADNRVSVQVLFTGSLDRLTVIRQSDSDNSSSQALLANIDDVGIYNEDPHHIRVSIDPQASSTLWYVYVDGALVGNGTINSIVMKSVREVLLNWGYQTLSGVTMSDRSFGYLTYWDATGPTAAEIYAAYMGFQGEKAGERIERLCTESGYTASVAGELEFQRPLGIQGRKKLVELLNEASTTNFGYLLERRDGAEVIHRGQSTLWNQTPALTLDFSAGLISPPFKPLDDDKLTENDVSVQREFGSAPARVVLDEGELSVQAPEDGGVGRYDRAYTYSLYTDDQAPQVASMRVHLGTYNGVRYARITLNLANERVYALIDDILRLDVGDKIRLTDLPADHGPDDVDVIVTGYSEEAGPDAWLLTLNCVPGQPWTGAVVGSSRADTGGCILAGTLTAGQTSVPVLTTGQALWVTSAAYPSDFPFDVRTGGEVMRATACASSVLDTFTRTTPTGWGNADSGQAWTGTGGAATDHYTQGSRGVQRMAAVSTALVDLITATGTDHDVRLSVSTDQLATGGDQYVAVVARATDANNLYMAQLQFSTSAGVTLTLRKRVGGTETTLGTWSLGVGASHTALGRFFLRLQALGSAIRCRAWAAAVPEPQSWLISATDTSLTTGTGVGARSVRTSSNTNANLVANYDDFELLNPQTLTVTRALNGVTKAHTLGQPISLATPAYVAM